MSTRTSTFSGGAGVLQEFPAEQTSSAVRTARSRPRKQLRNTNLAAPAPIPFAGSLWIASPIVGGAHTLSPVPYLRKTFSLVEPIRSGRLAVTALGLYDAEINGRRIGDQVFAPGWTDYKKRVQYHVHDVTALLLQGENVLGAILGDGWYCGTIGWDLRRQHYGDRPRLLAALEITFRDGTTRRISTDETWTTSVGPILESDFLAGESYDARLELSGWSEPGYDDSLWRPVLSLPAPSIEMNLSDAPPVRRMEELKPSLPRRFAKWPGEARLFDLGQNFSGWARIGVRAPQGTPVRLRFAEILNPDGTVYVENLRGARATDHYTCKGGGWETWEPRFTFHGFRYVEVSGLSPEDDIELTGVVLHSDLEPAGRFACSHPLLNQLQSNIVWSQKSNFLEVPTDCPQRDERLGWTGDAQVFIRTAAFNMDVRGFFRKWMRDIRDAQGPAGGVPPVAPNVVLSGREDGGPAWSDATIICPWTVYLCYEERQILADHYESMARYLEYTASKRCLGHIRCHPDLNIQFMYGDWLAPDGSGRVDGITPKDLIGTAFYAYDVDLMAKIASLLNKEQDAVRYRKLHGEIVRAFQERFVTSHGLVVAETQTAYVLALQFDLLPERLRHIGAKALAQDVERRGFHLATGFVGTPYILEVLEEHGYLDIAYKLLEQETCPSWLFPVKNGATTIWERWDGWTPERGPQDKVMNSYNHYAYGAVGAWMYRTVAGIDLDPNEPGYRHILFRPRPGGTLTWAEAELETPHGKTSIRWDKTRDGLKLDLTVPSGTHATLLPPAGCGASRALRPGRHRVLLKRIKDVEPQ